MNTNRVYIITTGLLATTMPLSAIMYLTNQEAIDGFVHMGFPSYFRIELAIAKLLGTLALVLPIVPSNIKEWSYAGFGITFVSASIAHFSVGDPVNKVLVPLVFLVILGLSYTTWKHLSEAAEMEGTKENE